MEFLAPYHPQLVHAPIALLVVSVVFEAIGLALDRDWWRRAAFAMLVVGALGGLSAVLSGLEAGERAEKQGVPEQAVDAHEEAALLTLWIAIAAVVARAAAVKLPKLSGVALVLQLAAAVSVGVAAHRGGKLVFEHAAAVRVNGVPVLKGRAAPEEHDTR
ncbi:MAG TPA: DUF2231 domain-containing protein [Candidatus Eisenbacteria bacterium]|nr:DUF2231 domain-containing protein [Candidatus Eisenbacteria bacterium]